MQRAFINWLPAWLFILMLAFVFCAAAIIFFYLSRLFFPQTIHKRNADLLNIIIRIASANYAFLLGFVIVILWQYFNQAVHVTTEEASHLTLIVFDSAVLPTSFQHDLLAAIGKYINLLRHQEWQTMKWGHADPATQSAFNNIFYTLESYVPQTEMQKTYYREIIANMNICLENRLLRLNDLGSILPDTLRFILIAGALLIGFFVALIESKSKSFHLLTIVAVTGVLAFNVGLALTLDYPFSGDISVSSKPYTEAVLVQFSDKPQP